MSASKDTQRGTWKVYIRYTDWMGQKQVKTNSRPRRKLWHGNGSFYNLSPKT